MRNKSSFFPNFHRAGLGCKPAPTIRRLIPSHTQTDALFLSHIQLLCGHLLPRWLTCFKSTSGVNSRKRVFTPTLTFWAWLAQVLDPASSCRSALQRVQAMIRSKGLSPINEDTAAYCRARRRLPAKLLIAIFKHLTLAVTRAAGDFGSSGRLLVIDGTTITLADSPANAARYAYASSQQKPGCGFPVLYLVGLFDLRTGAALRVVKSAARRNDSALAWRLLGSFKAGDTLIADRAFCSYAFIAELRARGVHVVMRLHQARARKLDMSRDGKRLGKGDRLQMWVKPEAKQLKSLHPARFAKLPETLEMRIVEIHAALRGHRSQPIYFATTLLNTRTHDATTIAELYLRRWEVELFFDDIKTSQNMDMLRCKSPDMVARELLMHLIAYNLVRLLMAQAQPRREVGRVGCLSFKGTLDRINQWQSTLWIARTAKERRQSYSQLLDDIASDIVPPRPGRYEPRVLKRRRDSYSLLTKPRAEMRLLPATPKHRTKAA